MVRVRSERNKNARAGQRNRYFGLIKKGFDLNRLYHTNVLIVFRDADGVRGYESHTGFFRELALMNDLDLNLTSTMPRRGNQPSFTSPGVDDEPSSPPSASSPQSAPGNELENYGLFMPLCGPRENRELASSPSEAIPLNQNIPVSRTNQPIPSMEHKNISRPESQAHFQSTNAFEDESQSSTRAQMQVSNTTRQILSPK